jgi:hypothetical protein
MSEKKMSDAFHNLRSGFDALEVDEQARFLVEAAMSLVANGAREAGNVVSTVVDDIVNNINQDQESDDSAAPEAAKAAPKPAPKKRAAKPRTRKKPAADAGSQA